MSILNAEVASFGNTLATVLESPFCPSVIREAIGTHLADLYRQADLTRPDIVRLLYALVAPAPAAPVPETTTTPAEEAIEAATPAEEVIAEPVEAAPEPALAAAPAESEAETPAAAHNAEASTEALSEEGVAEVENTAPATDAPTETISAESAEATDEAAPAETDSTGQELEASEPTQEEFAVAGEFGVNGAAQPEPLQPPA